MDTPLRHEGLQIEATLSMGNSLYSILLAAIIGAMALVLRDGTVFDALPKAENHAWSLVVLTACTAVLLIAYYIMDWHDLNRVPYFDKKIGILQMTSWMAAICVLSLSLILYICALGSPSIPSLRHHVTVVGMLTAIYIPLTWLLRNWMIQEDEDAGARTNFVKGQLKMASVLGALACMLAWCYFVVWAARKATDAMTLTIACITLAAWAFFLGLKIWRSVRKIAPDYKTAVDAIATACAPGRETQG